MLLGRIFAQLAVFKQSNARNPMPLVDISVIEGVFSDAEKQSMIEKVTDTMVAIEGEAMRGVTWVRVIEVQQGSWGIGGKALRAADVHAIQKGGAG